MTTKANLPRPFKLPWGQGHIVEEVQTTCPHWEPTIQLMEYDDGTRGLRFCYYQYGRFGRGPIILGEGDLDEMRRALQKAPQVREMLARLVSDTD